MGMFDTYDNVPIDYVPDNMNPPVLPQTFTIETDHIIIETSLGKKQNYMWEYGATFSLDFDTKINISVEDNAIIYNEAGEYPTDITVGVVGQKAYNTKDIISWQLDSITDNGDETFTYNWNRLADFTYTTGNQDITLVMDLTDKTVDIVFLDWFNNEFYTETLIPNNNILTFNMTEDLSKKFIKGIYYLHIVLDNNLYYQTTCRVG